ncbi:uncharacterized protein LOC135695292 isoform X2 [Rhopilema esculentum]|uniref:uncharacterized protein LOC135695292 isoform X2 n=1 Tax=Rhopilema esculentum TaxID=499914 RepID=UPI0031DC618A
MKGFLVISFVFVFILNTLAKEENSKAVVREIWSQVRGDSLQNLLADVRFPHKPSKVSFLSTFDTPTNDGIHFAQRLKGYFTAPTTGEYKFYSSCDDECEVFLGLDGKEGENNNIITQRRSSMHNEFDRFPDQVSHSIYLEKGKSYYLEEIGRQSTGRESLSLGVELPSGKRFFPIPSKFLAKKSSKSTPKGQKVKLVRSNKRHGKESESSEMSEGSLGKLLVSANGEKKSMKSDDYPQENFFPDKSDAQPQAVLEVEGADIETTDSNGGSKDASTEGMFSTKESDHKGMDEFELSPKLEVTSDVTSNGLLNEAGIEKAVEEALRQRNDKQENRESEMAFASTGKKESSDGLEGHGAEASKVHNVGVAEQDLSANSKNNDTVLEMNKVASEAGQIAMNLVNVTNFKVVIPGGKTYQISGSPGNKPLVTVVPNAENTTVAAQKDDVKNETAAAAKTSTQANKKDSSEGAVGEKTVTAVQHGNVVDVNLNNGMDVPKLIPTNMDHPVTPNGLATGFPLMGVPVLEHPRPLLDSSVSSLMYHPEPHPMDHPMEYHHEPHNDHMHIEVNSSVPAQEAPKPQKLDPEVIKVEFLPEGISVDTTAGKISKKCNHESTKKSSDPTECKEDKKEEKSKESKEEENSSKKSDSNSKHGVLLNGTVVAAPDAKMFVAPFFAKGLPGDVTVVPAERQAPVTRVLVQDIAADKNETKMNTVKIAPKSNAQEDSPFPTITGSVMNNVTGKPVPFEVRVVSNQQEAQQLAGGKGTNFTISADSRTFASGVTAGTNKKGQQQTIIILPDALKKHETEEAKDRSSEFQLKPEPQPAPASEKKPAAEKTFPVTMDNVSGGGGGPPPGEFIFPDMTTLNPGSDPSVVPASSTTFQPPANQNNQMPGMVQSNMSPMNQQQPQQQQVPDQDRVLVAGPPDNVYHGPVLSPIVNTFMTDLNKGSFSTEEALDLMNNYVSGSQDMSASIKKLQGVLQKVGSRDGTPQAPQVQQAPQINKMEAPVQQKMNGMLLKGMGGANSFNPAPKQPQVVNAAGINAPTGGEIAALLAIGPNKEFGDMDGRNRMYENSEEGPKEGESDLYNRHTYPENHFEQEQKFPPNAFEQQQQPPNAFMMDHNTDQAAVRQMSQMGREKPPPVHLFQNFDPSVVSQLRGGMNENMMRGSNPAQFGGPMEEQPMRENGVMPFTNNPDAMPHQGNPDFGAIRNSMSSFLNRIDPHEISVNPSVAMPENGLSRKTLSKRPQESNSHQYDPPQGAFYNNAPGNSFPGNQEEYTKRAPVESFHQNSHGGGISDLYTDSLFPEDIADIESLRGSLQGKTMSAYDRQEESQARAQGRSLTHPSATRQLKVSFPLSALTKSSRNKGALRSSIARSHKKISKRRNSISKSGRQRLRKIINKAGSKRSGLLRRKKHRKSKRDLVSIVPKRHPKPKVADNTEDIVLNVDDVAKSVPGTDIKEDLAKITTEPTQKAVAPESLPASKEALVNSKRATLAKVVQKSPGRYRARSNIPSHIDNAQPYFKDWKLDEEIRLLQQL